VSAAGWESIGRGDEAPPRRAPCPVTRMRVVVPIRLWSRGVAGAVFYSDGKRSTLTGAFAACRWPKGVVGEFSAQFSALASR
jgi:hypothetical protein